jgi:magnesium-transporting ATPase (P-type)
MGVGGWIVYTGMKRWGDWPYLLVSGLLAALLVYSTQCILRAYRRLQRVSHQDPVTLIDTLRISLAKIDAESRFSTGSVMIMILTGLSIMILIHTYYAHRPFLQVWGNLETEDYWGLSVGIVVAAATAYWFSRWHRRRFYSRPMARIQQAVREIEQEF